MNKKYKRKIRHLKIRKKVFGSDKKPRLAVFRSNKNIYAQLIDDIKSTPLASISTLKIKATTKNDAEKTKKFDQAEKAGELLAKMAIKNKINKVVFDRGGFKYHGRIKALADAAKKGGLKF